MATSLTATAAQDALRSARALNGSTFAILGTIARLASKTETSDESRDLLVRLLERREELGPRYEPLLNALIVRLGLFPYVTSPSLLSTRDQLAYEYHRPAALEGEDFVFHSMQRVVYDKLMAGESIVLSAPTSFGKSAVIDALVASGRWNHIVIVVPTLALIDETRRRLSRFSDVYKVITYPSQERGPRNLFIMTQERLLEVRNLPPIDLFVIDEFYKLDASSDEERFVLLNIAWDRLQRTGAQYYLTGPNIAGLHHSLPQELQQNLIVTDFRTVAVDERPVRPGDIREQLIRVCKQLQPPTLIYCGSPQRVGVVGSWLLDAELGKTVTVLSAASNWIANNYDPEWIVGRCLRAGIGLHHGRVPRALQHHIVRQFNKGAIDYLVCTSTLIEGVNTSARNVVILDGRLSTKNLDYFTFNNIKGRAGRMFQHFVGTVCLFKKPPTQTDTVVDIPISSQSTQAPPSALIQLPREELTPESYDRLRPIYEQNLLEIATLRLNRGTDPFRQLALADELASDPAHYSQILSWRGHPTWEQLINTCELMVEYLIENNQRGRMSARSLATRLNLARQKPGDVPAMVEAQLRYADNRDDAVEEVLFFLRNWLQHTAPRAMSALDVIQREVLRKRNLKFGNYRFFIREMESQFLPHYFVNLEEYGLPVQVAQKLRRLGFSGRSLDDLLVRLRALAEDSRRLGFLDTFEKDMLKEAAAGLGPHTVADP